jgi:hypothetical protein
MKVVQQKSTVISAVTVQATTSSIRPRRSIAAHSTKREDHSSGTVSLPAGDNRGDVKKIRKFSSSHSVASIARSK